MFNRVLIAFLFVPAVFAGVRNVSAQSVIPTINQQVTTANAACSNVSLGLNGALNGFVPSPNDAWHQDISALPVDQLSDTIMVSNVADLAAYHLHPDFGTQYGIPYNVVDTGSATAIPQIQMPMLLYPNDSDLTYYPAQTGMAIEGNPVDCPTDQNDRHLLIVDRHSCTNYELWQATPCKGSWSASNGLMFDLLNTEQRPYGLTSADASGLSVFEGLIRYDEILAGSINHAIRFTAPHTKANGNGGLFVAPATHAAGNLYGTDNIMGMRIRLKASFDISSFSATNQIILTAMKKYGLILTDNGSKLFFQGTEDSRWNDSDLGNLQNVLSASFEVVQMPTAYDAGTAPTGAAPVIQGLKYALHTYQGLNYAFISATLGGGSYSFVSAPGLYNGAIFRGFMALPKPASNTTFTVTSRNLYGTTTATITIP